MVVKRTSDAGEDFATDTTSDNFVARVQFNIDATDLTPQVALLAAAKPQGIFTATASEEADASIISRMASVDPGVPIVANASAVASPIEALGSSVLTETPVHSESDVDGTKPAVKNFGLNTLRSMVSRPDLIFTSIRMTAR